MRPISRNGALCGLAGAILYFSAIAYDMLSGGPSTTRGFLPFAAQHSHEIMGLHFAAAAAAILWAFGIIALADSLTQNVSTNAARALGVAACAVMVAMMIVQGTVMVRAGRVVAAAHDETAIVAAIDSYRASRSVDLGLDLAFDSLFFTTWMLLAAKMLRDDRFSSALSIAGLLIFGFAAVVNILSAPDPPRFDPAPVAMLWLAALFGRALLVRSRSMAPASF